MARLRAIDSIPKVATNGGIATNVMRTPLTSPTASEAARPAAIPTHTELPPWSTTAVTIAERHRIEPTERSIPPVMITAVIPIATIATKAKLRVTLNRFCGVANDSVASDSTTAASSAAASTQNACSPSTRCSRPWLRVSMARWRSTDIALLPIGGSCRGDRACDQPGHLFGAGHGDRLVGDLGTAAQHDDAIGHREHVRHAVADQHDGDALIAQPAYQAQHFGHLPHGDRRRRLVHQHDLRVGEPG